MKNNIQYGKKTITKVEGSRLVEVSQSIVAGEFIPPKKVRTEESVEVRSRAEQDLEYIHFADEEERFQKSGKLIDSSFEVRRTPASNKRGSWYVVKKYTSLDDGFDTEI